MHPDYKILMEKQAYEVDQCQASTLPEPNKAESCFLLAVEYWLRVKKNFLHRTKYSDQEEIDFFKMVKPRFTAPIEFYLAVNQGLLFVPPEPPEQMAYWMDEEKRYRRFYERHQSFITYYESNLTDRDADYFLRRNNYLFMSPQERIYEDEDCRSSHDYLVRGILAHEMYRNYVHEKLKVLKQLK